MSTSASHNTQLSRRAFLQRTALGAGALLLAGCVPAAPTTGGTGDAAPAEGVTTITFLTQGGANSEARYNPIYDMFQEQDGTVAVDFIWHPGGATDIQQKLLTLIAGGDAPDVYWTHTYINPGLAARDVPLELVVAPQSRAAVDRLLAAAETPGLSVHEEPSLTGGQAYLRDMVDGWPEAILGQFTFSGLRTNPGGLPQSQNNRLCHRLNLTEKNNEKSFPFCEAEAPDFRNENQH